MLSPIGPAVAIIAALELITSSDRPILRISSSNGRLPLPTVLTSRDGCAEAHHVELTGPTCASHRAMTPHAD
eukprot:3014148-Karenia_brevis.AAC.1